MKRFSILGALVCAAFVTPIVSAEDHHDRRYYDRNARDYHVYNAQEDRAYRAYLADQHRDYREFHRVKRNDQQQYFKWRHEHPDHVLFKVQVH